MRGNSHVRFGGRAEETDQSKEQHRASVRSNHTHGTLLIAAGVPSRSSANASVTPWPVFTIDTYQHLLPGMRADAARVSPSSSPGAFYRRRKCRRRPGSGAGQSPPDPVEDAQQRRRPRSVTWAFTHRWWRGRDLNPRPSGYERLDCCVEARYESLVWRIGSWTTSWAVSGVGL